MASERDGNGLPRYWESVLMKAVKNEDHTVELTQRDAGSNVQVEIDGVPMFHGVGYSEETFTIANRDEYLRHLSDEGLEKVKEDFINE